MTAPISSSQKIASDPIFQNPKTFQSYAKRGYLRGRPITMLIDMTKLKKAYYAMSRTLNMSQSPNAGEAVQMLNSLYTSTFNAPMKPRANPWEMVR